MKKKRVIIYLLVVFSAIIVDAITKRAAIAALQTEGTSRVIIPGFFSLTLFYNTGAAWSSFAGNTTVLTIVSLVAFVALSIYYFKSEPQRNAWGNVALALVIGGAISNGIDRLLYRKVTDFLDFIIFGYDFPVFNIADSCVVVGVILLLIGAAIASKKEGAKNETEKGGLK